MTSSPNNGEFAQQLEAIRQRLAGLRDSIRQVPEDRLEAQPSVSRDLQNQIVDELQTVLEMLQAAQTAIQQRVIQQPPPPPGRPQADESQTNALQVEQLRASLQEKETLLREIHHRVKNNLQIVSSLLDLQAMRTTDPIAQNLLRNNQSRISAIALVHDRLYQSANLTEIDLGEYIRNLATTLVRIYAIDPPRITLRTQVDSEILVPPDRAIPVGLILNELVSNALKHGLQNLPGEILITVEALPEQQAILSVSDTGNRLPSDFDPSNVSSLGFQLINALVQQLDGNLEIDRDGQTTVRVRFRTLLER